jgi:hypothetical protein
VPFSGGLCYVHMCTHDNWYAITKEVKEQCSIVVNLLIEKFARELLSQKFMNAIGIIYLLY